MTEPQPGSAAQPPDTATGDADRDFAAHRRYRTHRVEAFSDGVFAIAITLLVLEVAVPLGSEGDLFSAIVAQWPSYLAYIVSFATIGAAWLAHTTITEYLDHVDSVFIRLNLLLLLVISFIPFPTRLLAENLSNADAERIASAFYGLTLMLSSVLIAVLWRYAARAKLIRDEFDDEELRLLSRRLTPGIGGYVVLIGVGFIRPTIAVVGYLLIAVFFLIPFPLRNRPDGREPRGLRRFE